MIQRLDRDKSLRFFADCAAKKWPFGQRAISFQQSAVSLRRLEPVENVL
jgi:hypothetical protein